MGEAWSWAKRLLGSAAWIQVMQGEDILTLPLLHNSIYQSSPGLWEVGLGIGSSKYAAHRVLTTRVTHRLLQEFKSTMSSGSLTFTDGFQHVGEPCPPWNMLPPAKTIIASKPWQSPPSPNLSQLENFTLSHFLWHVKKATVLSSTELPWPHLPLWCKRPPVAISLSQLGAQIPWRVLHSALNTEENLAHFTDSPAAWPFCVKWSPCFMLVFCVPDCNHFWLFWGKTNCRSGYTFPHMFLYLYFRTIKRTTFCLSKSRKQYIEDGSFFHQRSFSRYWYIPAFQKAYAQVFTGCLIEFADQWAIDGVLFSVSPNLDSVC